MTDSTTEPTKEDLLFALREAHQEVLDLQAKLDEFKWLEGALRERTRELSERMKELQCLHTLSESVRESGYSLPDVLQKIVNDLPAAYQNPSRTYARLRLAEALYCSKQFRETGHRQSAEISYAGRCVGEIEVFVLPAARLGETPLLAEEAALLRTVATWIGQIVGHHFPSERTGRLQAG